MKRKSMSVTKLEGYLFTAAYGITFLHFGWLIAVGANPRPIVFLMACCAVWFSLITLITHLVEKNLGNCNRRL